jgi:hypothetical protein
MQVQVEHRTSHLGVKMPVRFRFGRREIEIVEIVDHWYGVSPSETTHRQHSLIETIRSLSFAKKYAASSLVSTEQRAVILDGQKRCETSCL